MTYRLFLDDEREPPEGAWVVVRSVEEAQAVIREKGFPRFVSFDHDLGRDLTGMDLARFLVELDLDHHTMPDGFQWYVHSQNPVGRDNINGYLNGYLRSRI